MLAGPFFVWNEDGSIDVDKSGFFASGRRERPLNDDELRQGAELATQTAPK